MDCQYDEAESVIAADDLTCQQYEPKFRGESGQLVRRFPRSQNFPYPRSKFLSCTIRRSRGRG